MPDKIQQKRGRRMVTRETTTREMNQRESITMIYVYNERERKIETTLRGINSPFMCVHTHTKTTTVTTTESG